MITSLARGACAWYQSLPFERQMQLATPLIKKASSIGTYLIFQLALHLIKTHRPLGYIAFVHLILKQKSSEFVPIPTKQDISGGFKKAQPGYCISDGKVREVVHLSPKKTPPSERKLVEDELRAEMTLTDKVHTIAPTHFPEVVAKDAEGFMVERWEMGFPCQLEQPEQSLYRITKMFHSLTQALQKLHSNYILHCDLKPDNCLHSKHDTTLTTFCDFGGSKDFHTLFENKDALLEVIQQHSLNLLSLSPEGFSILTEGLEDIKQGMGTFARIHKIDVRDKEAVFNALCQQEIFSLGALFFRLLVRQAYDHDSERVGLRDSVFPEIHTPSANIEDLVDMQNRIIPMAYHAERYTLDALPCYQSSKGLSPDEIDEKKWPKGSIRTRLKSALDAIYASSEQVVPNSLASNFLHKIITQTLEPNPKHRPTTHELNSFFNKFFEDCPCSYL